METSSVNCDYFILKGWLNHISSFIYEKYKVILKDYHNPREFFIYLNQGSIFQATFPLIDIYRIFHRFQSLPSSSAQFSSKFEAFIDDDLIWSQMSLAPNWACFGASMCLIHIVSGCSRMVKSVNHISLINIR